MVIGHNPTLQDLAIDLTGDGDAAAIARLHTKFPTAALAALELGRRSWDELAPGRAKLVDLILPKRLDRDA
jgi:phosphohistidine phosphatase